MLSYFQRTVNLYFYTSCTLTTLKYIHVSFVPWEDILKLLLKWEGCTHFCEILYICVCVCVCLKLKYNTILVLLLLLLLTWFFMFLHTVFTIIVSIIYEFIADSHQLSHLRASSHLCAFLAGWWRAFHLWRGFLGRLHLGLRLALKQLSYKRRQQTGV